MLMKIVFDPRSTYNIYLKLAFLVTFIGVNKTGDEFLTGTKINYFLHNQNGSFSKKTFSWVLHLYIYVILDQTTRLDIFRLSLHVI
jgi:hypothetical protein